ncbi:hypothetical protein HK101_003925, partial [Irineochytrium annulatum]
LGLASSSPVSSSRPVFSRFGVNTAASLMSVSHSVALTVSRSGSFTQPHSCCGRKPSSSAGTGAATSAGSRSTSASWPLVMASWSSTRCRLLSLWCSVEWWGCWSGWRRS